MMGWLQKDKKRPQREKKVPAEKPDASDIFLDNGDPDLSGDGNRTCRLRLNTLLHASGGQARGVVMKLHLENFKQLNEILGYDYCQDLLAQIISCLEQVSGRFTVTEAGSQAVRPEKKGVFGMYLDGLWYRLETKRRPSGDPVEDLDVSVLQDTLLGPVLGIEDPRTDKRIAFIGGIRGLSELERRCGNDMRAAFSMYPTSIEELFRVADEARLMPPKSTWFEPKLRSGLFIHII